MTFKPAGAHNPLQAPAVCLCVECSREVLTMRCPALLRGSVQCGDYRGHRGAHTVLVATVFLIAFERVHARWLEHRAVYVRELEQRP